MNGKRVTDADGNPWRGHHTPPPPSGAAFAQWCSQQMSHLPAAEAEAVRSRITDEELDLEVISTESRPNLGDISATSRRRPAPS